MNDLRILLDEYLATRRALGVRLEAAERYLKRFVAFAGEREAVFITTELALRWATRPSHAQPAQWAKRLGIVRGFARYANAVDPPHRIPPQGVIPYRYRRPRPYIYSDREIADLIAAARELLAVTGMRTGEILTLDRDDADLANGVLTVRDGKFGKSRHIPLHESTSLALDRYAARRDGLCPAPRDPAFFLSERGTRITDWTLRRTFVRLSRQTGLREPAKSNGRGPRLHDMRHRFAVDTLVRWYRDSVDVERHIPRLATWLGHAHVSDTYWYLSATPDLMRAAARRLDRIRSEAAADFPRLLAMFFSNHLMRQREASPHTIASYRDTFRLLVRYAQRELNKPPSELRLEDFDSAFIGDFLSHLENERGNRARSRNARLAAIRSFFRHVALHEPQHAALAQRVLAMPSKRHLRSPVA